MYLHLLHEDLEKNPTLKRDIFKLVVFITDNKKFKFDESEVPFSISLLDKNAIVYQEGKKYQVAKSALFFVSFMKHFKDALSFTLTNNIEAAFKFVDTIDEQFHVERTILEGQTEFFKKFMSFVLIAINREFNSDFISYALNLKREPPNRNIYKFNSALCASLTELNLNPESIFKILKHLYLEIETIGTNSLDVAEIGNSLRNYSSHNTKSGREFLSLAIKEDPFISNLTVGVIAGIYDTDRENFRDELVALATNKKLHEVLIIALSRAKLLSLEEANRNYDFISSIEAESESTFYSLSRFYSSTLENISIIDNKVIQNCFSKLSEMICHSNQNVRGSVLFEIRFINNYDTEIINLLITLLETPDYDTKFDKAIADIFYKREQVSGFTNFLIQYARKLKYKFDAHVFESAIYHFKDKEPDFSHQLVDLLIHDEGVVRFAGNRILTSLSTLHHPFKISFDILSLPAIYQFKLWVSVIEDFREPKYSLPLLLPLINSQYRVVQEAFIYKLEELTEDYFNIIIEIMQSELDLTIAHNRNIINRVQEYLVKFCRELDKKKGIKEFDPYYTESKLINSFNKKFSTSMKEKTDKSVNENSLFSKLATTVVLAKGGGWKNEHRQEVSQLTQFRTSYSLPREAFIEGEFMDWDFQIEFSANWKEEFKKWEALIS